MQDPPSPALIRGLAQLSGDDEPRSKFEMRLIGAALELADRADKLTPASEAAELKRLMALLGDEGNLDRLNRKLCALIRESAVTLDTAALAAHLRATTMEKLAIDQPTYAAYQRALQKGEG